MSNYSHLILFIFYSSNFLICFQIFCSNGFFVYFITLFLSLFLQFLLCYLIRISYHYVKIFIIDYIYSIFNNRELIVFFYYNLYFLYYSGFFDNFLIIIYFFSFNSFISYFVDCTLYTVNFLII